jgi:hypothetical protein
MSGLAIGLPEQRLCRLAAAGVVAAVLLSSIEARSSSELLPGATVDEHLGRSNGQQALLNKIVNQRFKSTICRLEFLELGIRIERMFRSCSFALGPPGSPTLPTIQSTNWAHMSSDE